MLRPLFATLFCVFAFSLSAQTYQDEVAAADVPAAVKQHISQANSNGTVRWQKYGPTYIYHERSGNTATELEITAQDGIKRQTTIHYGTELPSDKQAVEQRVSGPFSAYTYVGYGETTTASGDELTAVFLKSPGDSSLLIIYFDASDQLIARRVHRMAQ